jgi:hypothetical protein
VTPDWSYGKKALCISQKSSITLAKCGQQTYKGDDLFWAAMVPRCDAAALCPPKGHDVYANLTCRMERRVNGWLASPVR